MDEPVKKVTYNLIPTIKQFHECPEQMRAIIGPVGSGKTSAASMEIGLYKPLFLFHRYGITRTRWAVIRNCFDDQTEILTEKRGWLLFKDLDEDDKVASNVDGKLEYVKPTGYYMAPYKGEMIGFEGEGVNFLVTPDHNIYVRMRNARKKLWGEYKLRKAKDIYDKNGGSIRVKRDIKWDGEDPGYSIAFFEWLGFWYAEGSVTIRKGRHDCVIIQKNNIQYVVKLFKEANLPFTKNIRKDGTSVFRLPVIESTKPLIKELSNFGKAITKWLPMWVKNATPLHLKAFLKGYQEGDGSFKNGNPKKVDILYTSSKQLADDLQEIAFRAGLVANITKGKPEGSPYCINGVKGKTNAQCYSVTFVQPCKYSPFLKRGGYKNRYKGWYKQDYDGIVSCVEVPSHIIYVRRNDVSLWCSNTYPELIDTTLRTVKEWFPGAVYYEKSKFGNKIMFIEHPKFGVTAELLFRSCDNPDDVKKFKSLEITGYWIDESIEVDENVKKMLKNRLGRFPKKCPVRFGIETTNPPDVEHPTYSQFKWNVPPPGPKPKDEPLLGHAGFWQPPYENEENLRPGYYEDLKNDYADDPDWAEMYILGKPGIIIKGKIIYNNFRRDMHESRTPLEWKGGKIIRGWDNSGNIPACVILDMPTDTSVQALYEFTTERENIAAFASRVVTVCNQRYPGAKYLDFGDPAGDNEYSKGSGGFTSNSKIMYEECGVEVYPSEQNLTMRINAVEQLLSRINGFIIDPSLARLLNGFLGGYCYPKIGNTEWYSDKPMKNRFSHCLIGETLISTPFSKKRIDKIKVGDIVNTHKGPKIVTATMNSMSNQLVEISIDDGNSLTCTNNHPIAKNYTCFSRADALHYAETLKGEEELWADLQNMRLKNSMVLSFILNQKDTIRQIGDNIKGFICMSLSGNTLKEKFQKVIVSIIKIMTKPIIELKILRYHLIQNMQLITVEHEYCSFQMKLNNTWQTSDLLLRHGIKQNKEKRPVRKQQKPCGKRQNEKREYVLFAERNTKELKISEEKVFALWHASKKLVGILVWIMKKEYVHIAKSLFRFQNTPKQPRVQKIVPKNSDSVKVYDLTVEDSHTFYANGILVGNCHDALQYAIVRIFQSINTNVDDYDDEDEYEYKELGRSSVTGY